MMHKDGVCAAAVVREAEFINNYELLREKLTKRKTYVKNVLSGFKECTMENSRILIIEDDHDIREAVSILLKNEGYDVVQADRGMKGLDLLDETFDLVMLDVMMPGGDGVYICRKIREISGVPILFLTAKTGSHARYEGLMAGGDDYLGKPFSFEELLTRVKVLIRRYRVYQGKRTVSEDEIIRCGDIELNTGLKTLTVRGAQVKVTDIEYGLLELMMKHPDAVFSAKQLYETVWAESYEYTSSSTVMVHIRKLRKKIEKNPDDPEHIINVWGKGYRFE